MVKGFESPDTEYDASLTEVFGATVKRFGNIALDGLRLARSQLSLPERPATVEHALVASVARRHPGMDSQEY